MRKTVFTATLVSVLSLSTSFVCSHTTLSLLDTRVTHVIQNRVSFSLLLAMGPYENLKAYHIGLKRFFPNYRIPSAQNLLDSIRSHCRFEGVLTKHRALNQLQLQKDRYFIFEEKDNVGHFYIAYAGGLRHFTVNTREIAGLDNGGDGYFPSLHFFIEATI